MAETTTELERIYTIPLRRAHHGTRSKRANRAVRDVRDFLQRHMKSEDIWLDNEVNEALWEHGKFRIPPRIRVRATRFSDGVVEVTLPEQTTEGSIREAIAERLEKAAETPVLTPAGLEGEEGEEELSEEAKAPVTTINGVGPAMAEKLEKIEIETVGDLASSSAAAVQEATGRTKDEVERWIAQARELAGTTETAEAESEEEGTTLPADSEEE